MAVVEGGALGWPAWLWPLLAVPAVATVALVRFERSFEARGGTPLLPPSILSQQSMRAGLRAVVPFSVGYGSLLFVYALVAQGNLKLDGIESGAVGTLLLSTARAIGDDYASLVVIGLLAVFSVIVLRLPRMPPTQVKPWEGCCQQWRSLILTVNSS